MSWLSWQAWGYFVCYGHGGSRIEILGKKQKPEKLDSSLFGLGGLLCQRFNFHVPTFYVKNFLTVPDAEEICTLLLLKVGIFFRHVYLIK